MGNTFTVRLPPELAQWLRNLARRRGVPQSQIIKDNLEKARQEAPDKPFMKLAGSISGLPRDLSRRKGYSRS
jgi:predicted DNA-binding protein